MESFYGDFIPRNAPNPTSFNQNALAPSVPDVSMFSPNKIPKPSYSNWKANQIVTPISPASYCKENNSSYLKKQVRFESPSPKSVLTERNNYQNVQYDRFQKSEPTQFSLGIRSHPITMEQGTQFDFPVTPTPSRDLELSVLDNHRNEVPPPSNTYKDWLIETQRQQKILEERQLARAKAAEPTVSDLYQVIQQQNNSLQNLQRQVEMLLEKNSSCNCKRQPQVKNVQTNTSTNDPLQISIGVMTSFQVNVPQKTPEITPITSREVSFRPNNRLNWGSSTTQEGFSSKCRDYSLSEIPEIPEPNDETMSTTNSIHVDLQEYNESSEEEEEDFTGNEKPIGWTVYNNVVDQVKNILETSPRDLPSKSPNPILTGDHLQKATLEQLQNFGVNFGNLQIPGLESNIGSKPQMIGSNDVSIEVNQLVMKYLRDDQLSFMVTKNQVLQSPKRGHQIHQQNFRVTASPVNGGSNEMSFATVKYMQKYKLFNSDGLKTPENIFQQVITTPQSDPTDNRPVKYMSQNKILDITALKQQPKLL